MPRYCVNATVTVDAWAYVEADTQDDARAQSVTLTGRDFETGDVLNVEIEGVELDA